MYYTSEIYVSFRGVDWWVLLPYDISIKPLIYLSAQKSVFSKMSNFKVKFVQQSKLYLGLYAKKVSWNKFLGFIKKWNKGSLVAFEPIHDIFFCDLIILNPECLLIPQWQQGIR